MQEINFNPQTEEEKLQLQEFVDTHSLFELFAQLFPQINIPVYNQYFFRRKKLATELDLIHGMETKDNFIRRELEIQSESLQSEQIRSWIALFDLTVPELQLLNESNQIHQASGIRLVKGDLEEMADFDEEFIDYMIALSNGK